MSCSSSIVPSGPGDQLFERVVQLAVGERLVEEAVRALLHGLYCGGLVGERRDHQDQNVRLHLDQARDALDAVHLRHGDVHGDDVGVGLPEELQGLEAVAREPDDLQPIDLLGALDAPADDVRVVHDKQLERTVEDRGGGRHVDRSLAARSGDGVLARLFGGQQHAETRVPAR
jgi:hypothetical protein